MIPAHIYTVNSKLPAKKRQLVQGFTLLEMLVALMIMGLFLGLVSSIARPNDRDVLRMEADQLAQLLDLAAEESRITGRTIAWSADEAAYRFARLGEAGWSDIRDTEFLRARMLPQGMLISGLLIENMRPQSGKRLEFSPYGPAFSFSIELSMGTERYKVASSPIGEVRVFPGMDNVRSPRSNARISWQ